jgi:hypothetical protein
MFCQTKGIDPLYRKQNNISLLGLPAYKELPPGYSLSTPTATHEHTRNYHQFLPKAVRDITSFILHPETIAHPKTSVLYEFLSSLVQKYLLPSSTNTRHYHRIRDPGLDFFS